MQFGQIYELGPVVCCWYSGYQWEETFGQIHLAMKTNTICSQHKCNFEFGRILYAVWANMSYNFDNLLSVVNIVCSSEKKTFWQIYIFGYQCKYNLQFGQKQLAICKNTVCSLNKYTNMDLLSVVNTVGSGEKGHLVDEGGAAQKINLLSWSSWCWWGWQQYFHHHHPNLRHQIVSRVDNAECSHPGLGSLLLHLSATHNTWWWWWR